jgi:uncharacterized protein with PQ loop repeat
MISTTAALVASVPQVHQLLITKRSDELNITTWTVWLISQIVFLVYAATTFARPVLLAANVIWLGFYTVMICLIVYYRRNPAPDQTIGLESIDTVQGK